MLRKWKIIRIHNLTASVGNFIGKRRIDSSQKHSNYCTEKYKSKICLETTLNLLIKIGEEMDKQPSLMNTDTKINNLKSLLVK